MDNHNEYLCTGASHADDTGYGMSTSYLNPEKTASDRAMMTRFVRMWTSYAITGYVHISRVRCQLL